MAIDTKPNLSCCKFEQCSADYLYLSGCTDVYGEFGVRPTGIIDSHSGYRVSGTSFFNAGNGNVITAVRIGQIACANALGAIAIGAFSKVNTAYGIAIGYQACATNSGNIAIGNSACATGATSIYIGGGAAVCGTQNTVIGINATAKGISTVIGTNANACSSGIAVGVSSTAGLASVTIGTTANASGIYGIGIGYAVVSTAADSIGIGHNTCVIGINSIGIGCLACATQTNATAIGGGSKAFGLNSIAIGCLACADNTCALAVGVSSCATGVDSIAIGGKAKSWGDYSIAIGASAGNSGVRNIAIGASTLYNNTGGTDNIAMGNAALLVNTNGSFNIAQGYYALSNNVSGSHNIALGYQAMITNTDGVRNIAIGPASLTVNTSGNDNIALGYIALGANTTGVNNIGLGISSLANNTIGNYNIALGKNALNRNVCGCHNIALGEDTLFFNTGGTQNVAQGNGALYCHISGNYNAVYGTAALFYNKYGYDNVAIGPAAGYNVTGNSNVFLGNYAGFNETGSNKLYIDNSNTATPLIYGEFDTDKVKLNASLYVRDVTNGSASDCALTWDSVTCSIRKMPYSSGVTSTVSGERITKLINQPSHGFSCGTVIGWSGGTYNRAIANDTYNGEILGIVSKCYNTSCFDLTQAGYVSGLTSLSANTTYFLSDVTPGLLTTAEPSTSGYLVKAVLIANSSTSGWVLPYPGYLVTSGTTVGIVNANNGLTTDGVTVCLGGTLINNTTVAIGNKTLFISDSYFSDDNVWLALSGTCSYFDMNRTGANAYVDIWAKGGPEICMDGSTNRICTTGAVILNTTPAIGACTDSVLVWNSSDKLIKKVPYISGSTSTSTASGERITKLINQASHGFVVKDVIGWSGGTYNKAIACTTYNGEILGIVSKCYNANCFDLTQAGYVTGLTSLTANTTYFLSTSTAGLLTATKPTLTGQLVKSVIVADSTTSAWVLPYAAFLLSVSSGTTGSSTLSEYTITGNSSSTGFTINHAKNKQFVNVEVVKNSSPYSTIYTTVNRPNANCVCITFDTAPTTGQQYKILIIN